MMLRQQLKRASRVVLPKVKIPTIIPKRNIANAFAFSEQGTMPPPPPPQRSWRWPVIIFTAMIVSYGSFKYYTRHNFPPQVASKLKEGLRAEMDGFSQGKKNYQLALEKYLEALQIADELEMDHISDEYTGVQIKICEMYEKLGMGEEARMMYRELGISLVQALSANEVPSVLRPHLIQRDLRVALKTAMSDSAHDPNFARMGLLIHCKLAQNEIASKSEELKQLIESESNKTRGPLKLNLNPEEHKSEKNKERIEAWQPFRDELFSARDMYVALCLAAGDVGHALQTKLATTEWMTKAGCDIGQILMSFYNVGSIFYIHAEEMEVRELNAENDGDKERSNRIAKDALKQSSSCFKIILEVVQKLPSRTRHDDEEVSEVQAMSIYGLGVIALHQGDLETASERLREARLRAKSNELEDLMKSAELELEKVEKYKKGGNEEGYKSPTMDVLLMKKDIDMSQHTENADKNNTDNNQSDKK